MLNLYKQEFEKIGIKVMMESDTQQLIVNVDSKLIEHVLINVLRNAIEALEKIKSPQIKILIQKY